MFVYSLSGLSLSSDESAGPVEVEENETTARSSVYQWLGRIFTAPDLEHFELARDGRWAKELAAAAERLPYAFDVPEVELASELDQQSYESSFAAALSGTLVAGSYGGDREHALEEIRRAYEYFGLTASESGLEPDHLVSECDYLQYLTFREAATPSDRLRRSYRRAQIEFLDQHLAWTPNLVSDSGDPGRLPFVDWATRILVSFVAADAVYIRELVGP
jgi:hypothetical protein